MNNPVVIEVREALIDEGLFPPRTVKIRPPNRKRTRTLPVIMRLKP
jgi:hypothetical protein